MTLWKTKPGKTRRLPVIAVVLDCLDVLRERAKGHIFLNTEGNPVKTPGDWFDPCAKLAGLEDYTWHCNRHTFASRLVMAGVDLATVSKFMGHSTIQRTMRYAHLAPDHQKDIRGEDCACGLDRKTISKAAKTLELSDEVSTKSATRERRRNTKAAWCGRK
jgi:integrase